MNNLSSLENLMIKQTCRFFAYKFEMDGKQSPEEHPNSNIYSFKFLKALHDCPKDNIARIARALGGTDKGSNGENVAGKRYVEKRVLLEFFRTVVAMKSQPAKQWTDLQHYLCFVYRYCMTSDPDPEQEVLSPHFVADMRGLVCSLLGEDEIQLCLRLFSMVREYTLFAHKLHKKKTNVEASIESLFYYYEAFLSASKNISKIFPEIEKLLINTYRLGWLDINTSIFMYYFYETSNVQKIIREFEEIKDNVSIEADGSIKTAGIYTVLTELHRLWRSQILGINGIIAKKLGAKFRGLDSKIMSSHKRVLTKNFWIDRTTEEKDMQDRHLFDCQLFTLVGNKAIQQPDPTIDETGQCICEDCLIIKYKSQLENSQSKVVSDSIRVSCRYCLEQIDLDHFELHVNVNGRMESDEDGNNCKNLSRIISDNIDVVKLGMSTNSKRVSPSSPHKSHLSSTNSSKTQVNGEISKDLKSKTARERIRKNSFIVDINEITMSDSEMVRRSFHNLIKYKNSTSAGDNKENKCIIEATTNGTNDTSSPPNAVKPAALKNDEPKPDVIKSAKPTTASTKNNSNANFTCGHSCKLEEELKTEFKKAYQDTCDHHKESKKCDCTFCEVFGTTTYHVHKTNETRNRLRIRLSQRNEKTPNKTTNPKKSPLTSVPIQREVIAQPRAEPSVALINNITQVVNESNSHSLSRKEKWEKKLLDDIRGTMVDDIRGILSFIEGNGSVDKIAVAEKKAAKKLRQRNKKEQERLQQEEEERQREEEEKRRNEERIRNEELARQLSEKAAKTSKKENKKKKQKAAKAQALIAQQSLSEPPKPSLMEETIPAMVTIKRVLENQNALPTVTITLKGSTPDQDKLLYTLVNGHDGKEPQIISNSDNANKKTKKNKSKKQQELKESKPSFANQTVSISVNNCNVNISKKKKNKNAPAQNPTTITKELKVTLAVDSTPENAVNSKKTKPVVKDRNKGDKREGKEEAEFSMGMLKLPPGITITKVNGPMTDRSFKTSNMDAPPYSSSIPVSKSGVIVVDTEKLIKQSNVTPTNGPTVTISTKKSRKKRNKRPKEAIATSGSMVTLKNPIFEGAARGEPEAGQGQAAIFRNENGMVTIRSSRLHRSMAPGLMADLQPVMGPEVAGAFMAPCSFKTPETTTTNKARISTFNAQEILSGLPGIEITKVDKNATKVDESRKSCHTAEVSIIPTCNGSDRFNFDKDDLHYDNVFTPKDILEDDMDADELELEAFKRFCQQSVPPKRKEKVAHLNVKDIVLKKKNDKISA